MALRCEFRGLLRIAPGMRIGFATMPASAGLYLLPFAGRRFHETALSDFAPALLALTAFPLEFGAFMGLPLCLESVRRAFLSRFAFPGDFGLGLPPPGLPSGAAAPAGRLPSCASALRGLIPCTERGPSTGLEVRCGGDGTALTTSARVP